MVTIRIPIPKDAQNSSPRLIAIPTFRQESLHEHGVALASARAGNAIGGGDWTSLSADPRPACGHFMAGKPCLIRNPLSYRPWQFVLEPLRGYLLIAERLADDGAAFATRLEFRTIAKAMPSPSPGSPIRSARNGARERPGRRTQPSPQRKRMHSNWMPPRPPRASTGTPFSASNRRSSWIVEWYQALKAVEICGLQLLSRFRVTKDCSQVRSESRSFLKIRQDSG